MKKLILGIALTSLNAYATNVDLKITSQIKRNDSIKVTSSSVAATLGNEFSIPFQNSNKLILKLKVTEIMSSQDAEASSKLMFDAKIVELLKEKKKIIFSSKIITILGKEAKITNEASNKESFDLTILPSKIY